MTTPQVEKLLTPREVAAKFRVDPKTVTRWAKDGLLASIRTPGGHRRYLAREVDEMVQAKRESRSEKSEPVSDQ